MKTKPLKIGIYGGSFNPVHSAHIQLAKFACKQLQLDQIIFVPAFKNPDKINQNYASGADRIAMLRLCLFDKATIFDWEIQQNEAVLTYKTINHFKTQFPNDQLYFILGSDNLEHIHLWEGIEIIAAKSQIVSFQRANYSNFENVAKFQILLLKNPIYQESSTSYRQGNFDCVPLKIQKYIGNHLIYLQEICTYQNALAIKMLENFNKCLEQAPHLVYEQEDLLNLTLVLVYFYNHNNKFKSLYDRELLILANWWLRFEYFANSKILNLLDRLIHEIIYQTNSTKQQSNLKNFLDQIFLAIHKN